jgi:hypothetical protein
LGIAAVVSATVGIWLWSTAYERFAAATLPAEIARIEFQPTESASRVRVTRPEDIAAVRQWLLAAERPRFMWCYPSADCNLVVVSAQGDEIAMKVSMTLGVARGIDPGAPVDTLGYAVIRWQGYRRIGYDEPLHGLIPADVKRRLLWGDR